MENQNLINSTQKEEPIDIVEKPTDMATPAHPKPKFLSKGIAISALILIAVIFIASTIFVAYDLGKKNSSKQTAQTPPGSPEPTAQAATPTIDPTANWKIYNDTGFSFKYPNSAITLPKHSAGFISLQLENGDRIHVVAQNNSGNLSARDWLEKEFPPSESAKFEDIKISRKDSVQKNDYSTTHIDQGDGKILTINFVKCDGPGCDAGTDLKTFQEILSTFKFADSSSQSSNTTDWQTYINSKFGLTFKYPSDWKTTTVYNPESLQSSQSSFGFIPINKNKGSTLPPIYVEQYDNPDNLSFQDWDKKVNVGKPMTHYLYSTKTKTENISGLTMFVNEQGNCEPVYCKEIIIMKNNNVFVFRNPDFTNIGYTKEETEKNKSIFDQILLTFKFTH